MGQPLCTGVGGTQRRPAAPEHTHAVGRTVAQDAGQGSEPSGVTQEGRGRAATAMLTFSAVHLCVGEMKVGETNALWHAAAAQQAATAMSRTSHSP